MAYQQHISAGKKIEARCAVITLSDTRTPATDESGKLIQSMLVDAGHMISGYLLLRDEPAALEAALTDLLARVDCDCILTNGGTGISRRDQTIDVIQRMLTRPLPGYGELFRMLSYEQIGSGAMLSRTAGGVAGEKLLFAMPGSTKAVRLAMEKLILPELGHLVAELRK